MPKVDIAQLMLCVCSGYCSVDCGEAKICLVVVDTKLLSRSNLHEVVQVFQRRNSRLKDAAVHRLGSVCLAKPYAQLSKFESWYNP
jgi:hypothetical protein